MKTPVVVSFLCCLIFFGVVHAEDFIVKKRKSQNQSMNTLKENYANELAELVSMIPEMQKKIADLQQRLINELYTLLENDITLSKTEIDCRTCKAQELRCFLEDEFGNVMTSKASFVPQYSKKAPVQLTKRTQEAK